MKNKQTLYFRKNGTYVEFKDSSNEYLGFLLRRFLSFLIDVFIFAIVAVLVYFVFSVNIIFTSIIVWIILALYIWTSSVMLNDRTVGMYIMKLKFSSYDGRILSRKRRSFKLGIRAIVWSAFIVMPFINIAYFIICTILSFFVRTIFPVDFICRIQILTVFSHGHVEKVMTEWDEN